MTTKDKYITAVFNFDVDVFKSLLEKEPFDLTWLENVNHSSEPRCPIQWITQCWEIVFAHPEEWRASIRDTIIENQKRNLEIKSIFEHRFNVPFQPIDFYSTSFEFNGEDKYADYDEVIDEGKSRDEMIALGHKGIDLDLYVAVCKFNYDEVERLLNEGANPLAEISDDCSCMSRIGFKESSFCIEMSHIVAHRTPCNPLKDPELLTNLIGWAAHLNMEELLLSYLDCKEKNSCTP